MKVISQSAGSVNLELTPRLIFFYATAGHRSLVALYLDEQIHPLDFDLEPTKIEAVKVSPDDVGCAHVSFDNGQQFDITLSPMGVTITLWSAGCVTALATFMATFEELMPQGERLPDFGAMTLDELEEEARNYTDALQAGKDPYLAFCEQLELEPSDDSRAAYSRSEACFEYLEKRLGGEDPVYALCYPDGEEELNRDTETDDWENDPCRDALLNHAAREGDNEEFEALGGVIDDA